MVPSFANSAASVDLAPVTGEQQVALAVALALGITPRSEQKSLQAFVDHLRTEQVLLILDNCELVLAGTSGLALTLISTCPALQVVATPLHVCGEQVMVLDALSAPQADLLQPATGLGHFDAVKLFVERARAVRPGFALDGGIAVAQVRVAPPEVLPVQTEAQRPLRADAPNDLPPPLAQRLFPATRSDHCPGDVARDHASPIP